jgi:uncharacterized FlgJ-related protein
MAIRCTYVFITIITLFFTSFSYGKDVNKEQFVEELLPVIMEAKKQVGGNAYKIPNSFIVAQAAYESFWGTRYPKGNLFGLMSNKRPLKFPSLEAGTIFYLKNLLSNNAYEDFRQKIELGETNPIVLVSNIKAYSENSDEYARILTSIIKANNLFVLDDFGMKEGDDPGA